MSSATLIEMHLLIWLTLSILGLHSVQAGFRCNQTLTVTNKPQNVTLQGDRTSSTSSLYCWWHLISEKANKRVRIDVTKFELAGTDPDCQDEYMEAYDGNNSRKSIIKKWCGESRPQLISSNDSMLLIFKSNVSTSGQGFVITYYEETNFTCGGDLVVGSKEFELFSPGYPANYPNNLNCTWYMSAQNPNDSVSLIPDFTDLQPGPGCLLDSVTVKYDSYPADKFCDSNHAPSYVSPHSHMSITLTTNAAYTFSGFRFVLKSVPARPEDGIYRLFANHSENNFFSPDHFQSNLDFEWYIKAVSSGSQIKIQFEIPTLDDTLQCQTEWVVIYDGQTIKSPGLGKFCGNVSRVYWSSGQDVLVVFHPDPSTVRSGFLMIYTEVNSPNLIGCNSSTFGKTASAEREVLSRGNMYSRTDRCWRISSNEKTKVIHLAVTTSDIPSFGDCTFNYVKVYDGYDESSKLLGKWCDKETPVYNSSGPVVFIKFHSDGYHSGKGFELGYNSMFPNSHTGNAQALVGEIFLVIMGTILGIWI